MKICKRCDTSFTPSISKQVFCNKICMNKFNKLKYKKVILEKKCEVCSVLFQPKSKINIYCSEKCHNSSKLLKTSEKQCVICEQKFNTSYSQKIYCSDHCRENNIYKQLSGNLRNRIWYAIKEYKAGSAIKDLGCTVEELKIHLEKQFQLDMNWDNYGIFGWHIDHIKSLDSFDLTIEKDFKEACHYTNLQPLWAQDNLSKGAK